MLLEFQEKMIMIEEWWSSVPKVEVNSMIDLVLVRDLLHLYVQDVRLVRGMGQSLSDHHVLLCKVRLVRA